MSTINLAGGNTLLSTGAFPPVRAASTGSPLNPAAGGLLTVDGIALAAGDRVLCKDETSAVNNGIYSAQTGPWTRTNDAKTNTQFYQGMTVTCGPQGAVNAGQTFVCTTTDDPVVVGTSSLTFVAQAVVQAQQQQATSTTSQTIGTGSMTFATQSGKAFQTGQWVLVYETANSANQLYGQVTSYAGGSLTVNVQYSAGSGTFAAWTIGLANSPATVGLQPPVGSGTVTTSGAVTSGHMAVFDGTGGNIIEDGGAPVGGANTITPLMFANAAVGFAVGMLNGTLVASETSNALTITVKTLAGNTPSSSDPVFFLINNGSGGWTVIEQTSALSLTVPAGATLGTVNGQAGRQWIGVFNNAGTAVLGIYNSLNSSTPSILAWNESYTVNGTGISSGSTSAQIWYTASSLSSKNFRVIGYIESTQTTAGQWAATVTPFLFGPGVKRPGETYGPVSALNNTQDSFASVTFVVLSHSELAVVLTSPANLMRVQALGSLQIPGAPATADVKLSRGTTNATNMIGSATIVGITTGVGLNIVAGTAIAAYDLPNATSVTYAVQGIETGAYPYNGTTSLMEAWEIQI